MLFGCVPAAAAALLCRGATPRMVAPAIDPPAAAAPHERPSVALVALGCPKNTVDAEVMLGDLQRRGLRIVNEPREADIVIVNTCAFVEDAKRESIAAVVDAAQLKESRDVPARGLFVTGCLAQRYAEELAAELPEVDAVVGFESYSDIPDKVLTLLADGNTGSTDVDVGLASVPFRAEDDRWLLTPAHSAYIRVAEGCDHACTFCAIPGFRGSFRSKPFDTLLAEAERLVSRGVRELNLIAEDTNQATPHTQAASPAHPSNATPTHPAHPIPPIQPRDPHDPTPKHRPLRPRIPMSPHPHRHPHPHPHPHPPAHNPRAHPASGFVPSPQYGSDWGAADPRRLHDLITALAGMEDLRWIRLLYCYPSYFSEELIDVIACEPKVGRRSPLRLIACV